MKAKSPSRLVFIGLLLVSLAANAALWQRARKLTDIIDHEAVSYVNRGLSNLRDLTTLLAEAADHGRVTIADLQQAQRLADGVVANLSAPVDRYNTLTRGIDAKPYALTSTITDVASHLLILGRSLDRLQEQNGDSGSSFNGLITLPEPALTELERARDYYAGLCRAAHEAYPGLHVPEELRPGFVRRQEANALLWQLQHMTLNLLTEDEAGPTPNESADRRAWEVFQRALLELEGMVADLDAILARGNVSRTGLVDLQRRAFVATAKFELASHLGQSEGKERGQYPVALFSAVMGASRHLWSVFEQNAGGRSSVSLDATAYSAFIEERNRLQRACSAARGIFPHPSESEADGSVTEHWQGFLRRRDWRRAFDDMIRAVW